METLKTKADFKRALLLLRRVVMRWDPSGLFGSDAPPDEHDREVSRVIGRLGEIYSPADAERVLLESFAGWLGPDATPLTSAEAGRELFEGLQDEGFFR